MFVIALDFDGTCVDHRYPKVGRPAPGCVFWLKKWVAAGASLMLWTMRADSEGQGPVLTEAVDCLTRSGVELWAVNENPTQRTWSASHKQYAHVYVDDAGFGCPTIHPPGFARPCVDWEVVGPAVLALIESAQPKQG